MQVVSASEMSLIIQGKCIKPASDIPKTKQNLEELKKLVKVIENGEQYAQDKFKMSIQEFLEKSEFGNLNINELKSQLAILEKWNKEQIEKQKQKLSITFYDDPTSPRTYTAKEMQKLLLYCLGDKSEEINFANIQMLEQAQQTSIYIIEDAKLSEKFEKHLGKNFNRALKYACNQNWLNEFLRVHMKNPISPPENEVDSPCDRLSLVLSLDQLLDNHYPIPVLGNQSIVCSNKKYDEVTNKSPMFAIDCEMCMDVYGNLQLARISIVDEDLQTLLDVFVQPEHPIRDYLTCYSGITKEKLKNANYTIHDVQKFLQEKLPADAILVGHSLNADLIAIKIAHPYVIDTSVIFNLSGRRATKAGLKALTKQFLNKDIQSNDKQGHCSVEDAQAAIQLVKIKMAKGLNFGDVCMNRKSNRHKENVSLSEYLKMRNLNTKSVFYDYVQQLNIQHFVSVHSKYNGQINQCISNSLSKKNSICMVICLGTVYINVNS